ncbi:uncharacterized protein F4812DRAFT_136624 [Daldinia caldariorum]|uniref:uncharacterized protein n=1 Tax=Daldinia caldariorum TaxID=326644 RepID=UPI002008A62A|nr:uncharacterized protein F4812DRAFT_136624 [Daldinia caldariorum]KAI1465209.1 hypothetical protein F4812DRAFT_136624 [Daldinia caldariorum]
MEYVRGAKLRKEAKAMAADRRKSKEKYRLMRRWVFDKYKPNTAGSDEEAQLATYESENSSEDPAVSSRSTKGPVWHLPVSSKGRLAPRGLTLGTMFQIAEQLYKLSAIDFDTLSLADHIHQIQEAIQGDNSTTPVAQALVIRPLVVLAQHQQHLAKKDFMACVARIAIQSNLPECFKKNMQTCKDCFDRFNPGSKSCKCADTKQTCLHGPCVYHPGQIKSWGQENSTKDFLDSENVTVHEFDIWIHQCYWDCCGAKLLPVEPSAPRRNQKRKKTAPHPWETPNENDGSVGCVTRDHHVAIQ